MNTDTNTLTKGVDNTVDTIIPTKNKNFSGNAQELQKFLEPTRKPKVIYTDNSAEFDKYCELSFLESFYVNTAQIGKNGIAERAVRRIKEGHLRYCSNQVWTKNGGRIPWNATAVCDTFKISCQMGRHHMKGGSEHQLTAQLSRLEQWSKITLFLLKTYRDCINSAMRNPRGKVEIPMPAASPCRLQVHQYTETCCAVGEHMTNMLVLLKPTNL